MKTRLLKKIRAQARIIFNYKLDSMRQCWGKVVGIAWHGDYGWAFEWMMGKRLDYNKDKQKIIYEIARRLWKRKGREYWQRKLRPTESEAKQCG